MVPILTDVVDAILSQQLNTVFRTAVMMMVAMRMVVFMAWGAAAAACWAGVHGLVGAARRTLQSGSHLTAEHRNSTGCGDWVLAWSIWVQLFYQIHLSLLQASPKHRTHAVKLLSIICQCTVHVLNIDLSLADNM